MLRSLCGVRNPGEWSLKHFFYSFVHTFVCGGFWGVCLAVVDLHM